MNTRIRVILVLCVALFVVGSPAQSPGMDIVKNGRAVAVVVVQKPPKSLDQGQVREAQKRNVGGFRCNDLAAAQVLVDWIEKMTDVRLKIAAQPSGEKAAIYIGAAATEAGLDLRNIESPTDEGLRIISDGKIKILIAGQNETSTMKAVCRFLEELGCRYFMDNELGEVYPKSKTLSVGKLNIAEKPGLILRKIWGSKWSGQSLWKVWNGAGGVANVDRTRVA